MNIQNEPDSLAQFCVSVKSNMIVTEIKMDQQRVHINVVTHLLGRGYSCDSPVGKSICVLFTLFRHQWKSTK